MNDFEQIEHLADVLADSMRGRTVISRHTAEYVQELVNNIQEHLDNIVNELTKPAEE